MILGVPSLMVARKGLAGATGSVVLASDDFNRANGALGTNWGDVTGLSTFTIQSNAAIAVGSILGNRFINVSAPNDQYAKTTLSILRSTSDEGVGPAVRMASGAITMYFAQCNTTEIKLYRVVGGSFVQLGSDAAAGAVNDIILIQAVGTSITVKKNGTTIIGPITDANIASGDWGMWGSNPTGGINPVAVDNWEGGTP